MELYLIIAIILAFLFGAVVAIISFTIGAYAVFKTKRDPYEPFFNNGKGETFNIEDDFGIEEDPVVTGLPKATEQSNAAFLNKFAEDLGKQKEAGEFLKRAGYYKNLFDEESGFMRAKNSDGSWKSPFDPLSTHGQGYIEGNAWNYSLYVPHDVRGFIHLLGGNEKLITWLNALFTMETSDESIAQSEDIDKAGIIGNYVHGNEPSHHVPYMYCYAGAPWKTQERIHQIVKAMYRSSPDGLCGNDDCGQMSAWYIFSVMGFYPVCPGSNEYVIGSPCVGKAIINLENGNKFTIEAKNLSGENIYIQSVTLNDRKHDRSYLMHSDIINGGTLIFTMGPEPNKEWGVNPKEAPYSMSR